MVGYHHIPTISFGSILRLLNLADIKDAFQMLDNYNIGWVILPPTEHLAKALAENTLWNEVYSDKYSIVFVRRR